MENNKNVINPILELALVNGLSLAPHSLSLNESGLDFLAGYADDDKGTSWVLRLPRREDVVASAAYEQQVLSLVKSRLPVTVPDWKVHTAELIAYPRLAGVPAATIDAEVKQYVWEIDEQNLPDAFVDSLAATLAAIHMISPEEARSEGIRTFTPSQARSDMKEKLDWVKSNYSVSDALWTRWQSWMEDDSYWPDFSTVVHGDLHPGHLLIDEDGRITGILDWTEGEVTDPSIDFQIYYALFGHDRLNELLERYALKGGRTWPRMAEHIIERYAAYPVLVAWFAEKIDSEEYRQMASYQLNLEQ